MNDKLTPAEEALRDAALEYHRSPHARQDLGHAHQAAVQPARPVAGLFARRGLCLPGDQGRPQPGGRVHLARQPGRRHHQRHGGAGPGRHRRAGRQAGDGRQGLPVQEVRRHRRVRHRTGRARPGQAGRHHRRAGAHAGRHQPRGHQGAGVLLHREEAARAAEHPGVPRRPARHGDHLGGGAAQRPGTGGQGHRQDQDGGVRRRRGGHRLPGRDGRAGREHEPTSSSATPRA